MSVEYRTATAADAGALAELGAHTFTDTFGHLYQPDDLAIFLQNHSTRELGQGTQRPGVRSARGRKRRSAGRLCEVGPAALPFEPRGEAVELRQLYVVEEMKGQGVARALMDWVIDRARDKRADNLYLSVFTENHRARRFYEKYGFEPEGTYAFMVGNHADEDIVMRLKL